MKFFNIFYPQWIIPLFLSAVSHVRVHSFGFGGAASFRQKTGTFLHNWLNYYDNYSLGAATWKYRQPNRIHSTNELIIRDALWALPIGKDKTSRTLSAAEEERRREDERRRERSNQVVPGQTSAIPGARDYAINVDATRAEWLRQANAKEQLVVQQTEIGIRMLKSLRLEEALQAFDRVLVVKPDAYLWQAGLARFYTNDWDQAANILVQSAARYEAKFGEPASEERLWRDACFLKKLHSLSRKERKDHLEDSNTLDNIISQAPGNGSVIDILLQSERRKVIRIARELFAASVCKDHIAMIWARARLRSIAGALEYKSNAPPQLDRKMWKITSWFYLGLHYDVLGEAQESKLCMKRALQLSPNANSSDFTHILPMLHMTCREWYDDDLMEEYDAKVDSQQTLSKIGFALPEHLDPIFVESIRTSLDKTRYVDIQQELKKRRLSAIGSKEELQNRLLHSMLTDTGLMSN